MHNRNILPLKFYRSFLCIDVLERVILFSYVLNSERVLDHLNQRKQIAVSIFKNGVHSLSFSDLSFSALNKNYYACCNFNQQDWLHGYTPDKNRH